MWMASRVQRNALVFKKADFLPENGYKYVGLICEYHEERWTMPERCAYISLWFIRGFRAPSILFQA